MSTTQQILDRYNQAFDVGDLDQLMALYCDQSVLVCDGKICRGRKEIREFFTQFTAEVLPPDVEYNSVHEIVEGEIVYLVWNSKSKNVTVRWGTDTLVIRNDTIVYQTACLDIQTDANKRMQTDRQTATRFVDR